MTNITTSGLTNVTSATPSVTTLTVAPGATEFFTVNYTPTFAGAFSFDLDIISNDADENPYDITVSGTATGDLEIEVSSSVSGAIADGGTDLIFLPTSAGTPMTVTYTVTNSGTSNLLLLSTATAGTLTNVDTPIITAPTSTSLFPGGGTATFQVTFTPTLAGVFVLPISLINNDGDENPFDFDIVGVASGDPEIEVSSSVSGAMSDGGIDTQGAADAGTPTTVTYTVTNSGTANLAMLLPPTAGISSNVGTATITSLGALILAGGGVTTTFDVTFTPTAPGPFSLPVSLINNDGDENPFDFTISGTAIAAPEIEVSSSASGAIADDGTDVMFGPSGTPTTVTYTVTNNGSVPLLLSTATAGTLDNVDTPTITAPTSTSLAPGGGTATFQVTFTPTLAGLFSLPISLINNDSDENPFDFTIGGIASGEPEIEVSSSVSGAMTDGGIDTQGAADAGTPTTVTYTVTNSGTANLVMPFPPTAGISSNVGTTTITPLGATVLAGGGETTTFDVTFTPTVQGPFSLPVSLFNNDDDENPFDFTISGVAAGEPEMDVSGNGTSIPNNAASPSVGNNTDFGIVTSSSSSKNNTFTITNSGTSQLNLTDTPRATIGGAHASDFSLSADAATSVAAAGGTTSFVITFNPTANGLRTATISLDSDDSDENPYSFFIQGTAIAPEIAVSSSESGAVSDGGTDGHNTELALTAKVVTYTVDNTAGLLPLNVTNIATSGLANVFVAIPSTTSLTVAPGAAETFTVTYVPTSVGAYSFDIALVNDDLDESPFDILVNGTATGDPEVSVLSSESGAVADGGTDAHGNVPSNTAKIVTYGVDNTAGLDTLNVTNIITSGLTNVTSATPSTTTLTVAPGNIETFDVTYTPTLAGPFSFDIAITNDDPDENPYDVTVSGTGTGDPEIAVSSSVGGDIADGDTDAQGDRAPGTPVTVTYTVDNTAGLDTLNVTDITTSGATNVSVGTPSTTSLTVAPGTAETFTVTYTPTLAGAFSFDIAITNDDLDENPYNIAVSGAATGDADIDVSSSIGGTVADGGTDDQGTQAIGSPVAVTYTITNTGSLPLNLTGAPTVSNVVGVSLPTVTAPVSSTVAPGGGTTTFGVTYTPAAAGAFSFDLDIVSNDPDESPYDVAVSGTGDGTAIRRRTQAIASNFMTRRGDQITSNEPNLVGRLTGNGGGGAGTPIAFSANDGLDRFNFAFAATGRDIGNADAGRDAAKVLTLAALGLVGEAGGDAANAALQAALAPLMAYADEAAIGQATDGRYPAAGSGGGGSDLVVGAQDHAKPVDPVSRFDFWTEGQWAHADDETRESDFALLNFGADYRINPSLLIGVLAQIDWMDEKDMTEGTAVDGVGWMAGPYVVARLHQNVIFDGRVAGGQSDNHADLGISTGDFETNRWLAKAQLTGDFRRDNWRFSPHVAAIYFEENQKAYTDSLDILIPSQTVSLGRVTFGPEVSYVYESDGLEIQPHFALKGIWDFDKAEIVDLTSGLAAGSSADLRARVEGGVSFRFANGVSLTGDAFYDGIGADGLDMYGGSATMRVPLN